MTSVPGSTRKLIGRIRLMLARIRWRVEWWRADLQRGIDTRGVVIWQGSSPDGEARPYMAVTTRQFGAVMRALPVNPSEYVFIDLGAGKGAAVVFAAEHGFRRSIAVELHPGLCSVAEDNKQRLMRTRPEVASRMEVVKLDAREYVYPEEPCVVYIYNAFGAETMTAVLANIERSLRECPRRMYLLYALPVLEELVNEVPVLRPIHRHKNFLVYESTV